MPASLGGPRRLGGGGVEVAPVERMVCLKYIPTWSAEEEADFLRRACEAAGSLGYHCECARIGEAIGEVVDSGRPATVGCEGLPLLKVFQRMSAEGDVPFIMICIKLEG